MEKNNKVYIGEYFDNARKLVSFLNEKNIPREDIVTIYPKDDFVILIYYGREL